MGIRAQRLGENLRFTGNPFIRSLVVTMGILYDRYTIANLR